MHKRRFMQDDLIRYLLQNSQKINVAFVPKGAATPKKYHSTKKVTKF